MHRLELRQEPQGKRPEEQTRLSLSPHFEAGKEYAYEEGVARALERIKSLYETTDHDLIVVVNGSGTDVGKTYLAAELMRKLTEADIPCASLSGEEKKISNGLGRLCAETNAAKGKNSGSTSQRIKDYTQSQRTLIERCAATPAGGSQQTFTLRCTGLTNPFREPKV